MTQARWSLAALALAVVTAACLAFLPANSTSSCVASSVGAPHCTASRTSLLTSEGPSVLVVLSVPAALLLLAAVVRRRWAATAVAVLLSAGVLLGAASIGLFFVPTLVLAWVAAASSQERKLPEFRQ